MVLVVDNHDGFRVLMGAFLSRQYEVVVAKSGLEAMSRLSQGQIPDAIVMDASLSGPGLDSESLMANLRCSGLFGGIPVIIISGTGSEQQEQRFRKLGAAAYFKKPFNPEQLQEQLDHYIQLSRQSGATDLKKQTRSHYESN
jgi:CheY-like chemotaxis protein